MPVFQIGPSEYHPLARRRRLHRHCYALAGIEANPDAADGRPQGALLASDHWQRETDRLAFRHAVFPLIRYGRRLAAIASTRRARLGTRPHGLTAYSIPAESNRVAIAFHSSFRGTIGRDRPSR